MRTVVDIDQLRTLDAAATPAPWVHDPNRAFYLRDELHEFIAAPQAPDDETVVALTGVLGKSARGMKDAALIAAVRNALPRLLQLIDHQGDQLGHAVAGQVAAAAEVARLTGELAAARARCQQLEGDLDRIDNDFETVFPDGRIAVTLTVDHRAGTDWAGHITVYGFATHRTATTVGQVLADALARHSGAPVRPDLIPTNLGTRIGTGPAQSPAYVHRLVDAVLTGDPLDFGGEPVPQDVQRRLDQAVPRTERPVTPVGLTALDVPIDTAPGVGAQ